MQAERMTYHEEREARAPAGTAIKKTGRKLSAYATMTCERIAGSNVLMTLTLPTTAAATLGGRVVGRFALSWLSNNVPAMAAER
jgi:hypothetical protein